LGEAKYLGCPGFETPNTVTKTVSNGTTKISGKTAIPRYPATAIPATIKRGQATAVTTSSRGSQTTAIATASTRSPTTANPDAISNG
jgi:alpha-beta hydrolase superfamily lysophospholipase